MHRLLLTVIIFAVNSQLAVCPISTFLRDLTPISFAPRPTPAPGTPPITSFVQQIPNLFGLCFAFKTVPHRVTVRIKEFLEEIVPQIPDDNILKFHFNNILLLLSTYKSIIDAKKETFKRFTDVIQDWETNRLPAMFQNRHIDDDIPDVIPSLPELPKLSDLFPPFDDVPLKSLIKPPFSGGDDEPKRSPAKKFFGLF